MLEEKLVKTQSQNGVGNSPTEKRLRSEIRVKNRVNRIL